MAADSQPPEGLQLKISDDEQSRHPQAFDVLYGAYRHMDCVVAVDPLDPDDCANVAEESIRVLMQAGLLPSGGEVSTEVEWAVRRDHEGNGTHWVSEPFYRQEHAEALLATIDGGGDPVYVVSRHIQAGPWWSPVVPDSSEAPNG